MSLNAPLKVLNFKPHAPKKKRREISASRTFISAMDAVRTFPASTSHATRPYELAIKGMMSSKLIDNDGDKSLMQMLHNFFQTFIIRDLVSVV